MVGPEYLFDEDDQAFDKYDRFEQKIDSWFNQTLFQGNLTDIGLLGYLEISKVVSFYKKAMSLYDVYKEVLKKEKVPESALFSDQEIRSTVGLCSQCMNLKTDATKVLGDMKEASIGQRAEWLIRDYDPDLENDTGNSALSKTG